MNYLIVLPIIAAFLLGAGVRLGDFETTEKLNRYAVMATLLVSACVAVVLVSTAFFHFCGIGNCILDAFNSLGGLRKLLCLIIGLEHTKLGKSLSFLLVLYLTVGLG